MNRLTLPPAKARAEAAYAALGSAQANEDIGVVVDVKLALLRDNFTPSRHFSLVLDVGGELYSIGRVNRRHPVVAEFFAGRRHEDDRSGNSQARTDTDLPGTDAPQRAQPRKGLLQRLVGGKGA